MSDAGPPQVAKAPLGGSAALSSASVGTLSVEKLLLQLEVDQLNAAYAAALDERRFDDWPEFFLEDACYKVQARENFDRGLPLTRGMC
jgi:hypothetical protein